MNTRQKIIGIIGLVVLALLLILGPSREAHPGPILIERNAEKEKFDLTDPVKRAEFRKIFVDHEELQVCFSKADYAITFFKERDAGTTEAEHLAEVRANYELTKLEPKGVVSWHVYVDFQRMVRDIHRRAGRNSQLGYRYTDADVVWDREFQWCAIKRNGR
jgi:hypothetical protein